MEIRVHAKRLSSKFKRELYREIAKVDEWEFTSYSLDKISKRNIPVENLSGAVVKGTLIEYHTKDKDRRVLFRCVDGTCVVVDLDKHTIITAYTNDAEFNHPNLNQSKYMFGA